MSLESQKLNASPKLSSTTEAPAGPLVLPETAKAGETKDQLAELKTKLGDKVAEGVLDVLEDAGVDVNGDGKLPSGVAPAEGSSGFLGALGGGIMKAVNTILVGLGLKEISEEEVDSQSSVAAPSVRERSDSRGRRVNLDACPDKDAPLFTFNVIGVLTSIKGPRVAPKTSHGYGSSNHGGSDLAAPGGTQIVATTDIEVLDVKSGGAGGNRLLAKLQPGNKVGYFMHLQEMPPWKAGDIVRRGEEIGLVGATGNTSGPHLHFQVGSGANVEDPQPWLPERYHNEHEDERVA